MRWVHDNSFLVLSENWWRAKLTFIPESPVERSVATCEGGGLMKTFNSVQTLTLDSGVIFHTIYK